MGRRMAAPLWVLMLLVAALAWPGPRALAADPTLEEVQRLLNQLSYQAGPVDGIAGPRTSAALARYQIDHGLVPTGSLTDETLASLRRVTARPPLGSDAGWGASSSALWTYYGEWSPDDIAGSAAGSDARALGQLAYAQPATAGQPSVVDPAAWPARQGSVAEPDPEVGRIAQLGELLTPSPRPSRQRYDLLPSGYSWLAGELVDLRLDVRNALGSSPSVPGRLDVRP